MVRWRLAAGKAISTPWLSFDLKAGSNSGACLLFRSFKSKKEIIMKRIFLALMLLGSFLAIGWSFGSAQAQNQGTGMSVSGCGMECSKCQALCEKSSSYVRSLGGKAASPERLKLFADCISICKTSKDFLARDSQFHPQVCGVCADVCNACAKSCEALNDPKLEECIKQCKKCTDSCRKMAS